MDRFLMDDLIAWRSSPWRKPLVLMGARQVGKTWLLREFGRRCFANVAEVNFDGNPGLCARFERGYDTKRLLRDMAAESGQLIAPDETLIIMDEIQECPKALTSLKYFCEREPGYAIAAAGSLLGIAMDRGGGTGWPVGKVDELRLHPLSFREYLDASGQSLLRQNLDEGDSDSLEAFSDRLRTLLAQYLVVGGMPEVARSYLAAGDLNHARRLQVTITDDYRRDMAKHVPPTQIESTIAAWESIPAHLGQENKRFIFSRLRKSGRARDFERGVTWLDQAGLVTKVRQVTSPRSPLGAYAKDSFFKLFLVDVGLLGAMARLDPKLVLDDAALMAWFKGALIEQFACQQIVAELGEKPFYWTPGDSSAEADFLVERPGGICLAEVKSSLNVRSESLRSISRRFPWLTPIRLSPAAYEDQGWMVNIPLYAAGVRGVWDRAIARHGEQTGRDGQGKRDIENSALRRRKELLAILDAEPPIDDESLAERLHVSRTTVRRDVKRLRELGLLDP